MSKKIGSGPVNFSGAYSNTNQVDKKTVEISPSESKQNSVSFHGEAYGRSQVVHSVPMSLGSTADDIAYFKEKPEMVSFCGEIFDYYSNNGTPYIDAVNKSLMCAEAFDKIG